MIGYKKAIKSSIGENTFFDSDLDDRNDFFVIVKLRISPKAKVIKGEWNNVENKHRASSAKVLEIISMKSGRKCKTAKSKHDFSFKYKVGETVRPIGAKFDMSSFEVCTSGIHFFLTEEEARNYYL